MIDWLLYFSATSAPRFVNPKQQISGQPRKPETKPKVVARKPEPEEVYDQPVTGSWSGDVEEEEPEVDGSSDDEFYMNVDLASPLRKVTHDYDDPPPRPPRKATDTTQQPPSLPAKRGGRVENGARVKAGHQTRAQPVKAAPQITGFSKKPGFSPKPGAAKTLPWKPAVAKQGVQPRYGERSGGHHGSEEGSRLSATMPGRFGKTMLTKRIQQFNHQ